MLAELKVTLMRHGKTQTQLAQALRRHPSFVSRLIRGQIPARTSVRRRIAQFLGVPEREVFPRHRRTRPRHHPKGRRKENGAS